MSDIEYITDAEKTAANKLAACASELIDNWLTNNGDQEPYVILAALTKLLTRMLHACPDKQICLQAVVFVIHMLLGETQVDHKAVLHIVAALTAGAADGGFNA